MSNSPSQIAVFRKKLKTKLSPVRYEHSLSVSYTCMCLAMRYGYDIDKAELAGLLHDCGKRFSDEVILKKCEKNHIPLTDAQRKATSVLHANYGVWLAQNKFQIQDEEILNAILYHTTGRPEMTLLEKILYVADFIEPRRSKAPNLSKFRQLAFEDLEETIYQILEGTLKYLSEKGGFIHPATIQTYEYYKEQRKK